MKIISIFIISFFLFGCTVVPIKRDFPEVPKKLMESCQSLEQLEEKDVLITDLLKTVVKNYQSYHECSIKVEFWKEWYKNQKLIFESVK